MTAERERTAGSSRREDVTEGTNVTSHTQTTMTRTELGEGVQKGKGDGKGNMHDIVRKESKTGGMANTQPNEATMQKPSTSRMLGT